MGLEMSHRSRRFIAKEELATIIIREGCGNTEIKHPFFLH